MTQTHMATGGDWFGGIMDYGAYKSHGFRFAMRYIVPQIPGKMIQHAEILAAHSSGIDLGFIYETDGRTWQSGASGGVIDGTAARLALKSIAAPETCAGYMTIDSQAMPADITTVLQYLSGAAANLAPYKCGVYGEYAVVEAAYTHLPHLFRWQTPAWSHGQESQHVDLFQIGSMMLGGVELDVDAAYQSYFGQWYADPSSQPINPVRSDSMDGNIPANSVASVPVPPGTASKIMLFCDIGMFGGEAQEIRVAIHSVSGGYSQITKVTLGHDVPETLIFTARDVDAVSLSRAPGDGNGTIGYYII